MGKMKWRVLKDSEYRKKIEKVVIKHEGNYPVVYLDEKGIPTTGPGKALVVHGVDKKTREKKWVVAEGRLVEGVNILESTTGKPLTAEQRQNLQTAADNMNKYGLDNKTDGVENKAYRANAPLFYKDVTDDSLKGRTDPNNNTFGVLMDKDQTIKFKDKVVDASEQEFDRFTTKSGTTRLDEAIPPSEERAALISIFHHRPADINSDMREAINEGDREGVINAIESSETAKIYKTRRKGEADQFGRPDNPDVIRNDNNSQADLDATFKTPAKTTPNSGPFQPKTPEYQPQQPKWEPIGPSEDVQPTQPRPSILDSAGQVVGQIGGAISTVGRATFDMATSLGKETLNQLIQMALSGGANGKDVMKRAVQLAMGNMVASMQQAMLAEIANIGNPNEIRITGIAGDIIIKKPTEDVMNAPQNQGLFDQMADVLLDMLGLGSSKDPSESMTDIMMMSLRNGDVKLPGNILLPDIYGKGQTSKDGRTITVFGIPIPVGFPSEVIFDGPPQLPGVWDEAQMYRRGDMVRLL